MVTRLRSGRPVSRRSPGGEHDQRRGAHQRAPAMRGEGDRRAVDFPGEARWVKRLSQRVPATSPELTFTSRVGAFPTRSLGEITSRGFAVARPAGPCFDRDL